MVVVVVAGGGYHGGRDGHRPQQQDHDYGLGESLFGDLSVASKDATHKPVEERVDKRVWNKGENRGGGEVGGQDGGERMCKRGSKRTCKRRYERGGSLDARGVVYSTNATHHCICVSWVQEAANDVPCSSRRRIT